VYAECAPVRKVEKMSENDKLSIRAFAKLIGVSEGAVRKAITAGKLSAGWDELNKKIDPVRALENPWVAQLSFKGSDQSLSTTKKIEAAKHLPENPLDDSGEDENWIAEEELRTGNLLNAIKVTSGLKASEAMRRREIIALALDKKKLEELEGILVRRKDVDKSLFAVGNEMKKSLMNMPQRVVRLIMKAPTEVEGITILTNAITEILKDFGNLKLNTDKIND
jgi:hypothetical protein